MYTDISTYVGACITYRSSSAIKLGNPRVYGLLIDQIIKATNLLDMF